MNTTVQVAHDHALRGLMLLLVEVQNIVRETDFAEVDEHDAKRLAAFKHVEQLVESPETSNLLQLARAALETPAPAAIPAAAAGVHE